MTKPGEIVDDSGPSDCIRERIPNNCLGFAVRRMAVLGSDSFLDDPVTQEILAGSSIRLAKVGATLHPRRHGLWVAKNVLKTIEDLYEDYERACSSLSTRAEGKIERVVVLGPPASQRGIRYVCLVPGSKFSTSLKSDAVYIDNEVGYKNSLNVWPHFSVWKGRSHKRAVSLKDDLQQHLRTAGMRRSVLLSHAKSKPLV